MPWRCVIAGWVRSRRAPGRKTSSFPCPLLPDLLTALLSGAQASSITVGQAHAQLPDKLDIPRSDSQSRHARPCAFSANRDRNAAIPRKPRAIAAVACYSPGRGGIATKLPGRYQIHRKLEKSEKGTFHWRFFVRQLRGVKRTRPNDDGWAVEAISGRRLGSFINPAISEMQFLGLIKESCGKMLRWSLPAL
jgi:hypothetical protein